MNKVDEIKNNIPVLEDKLANICKTYDVTFNELLTELIRFLDLIHFSNNKLSPSYIVDLAWHEFILFTRFYERFCNKHYHRFIHHTPGKKENKQLFLDTIKLYIQQYGKPNIKIWGNIAHKEWETETANCGSCYN